jgi:hypothetical protein
VRQRAGQKVVALCLAENLCGSASLRNQKMRLNRKRLRQQSEAHTTVAARFDFLGKALL